MDDKILRDAARWRYIRDLLSLWDIENLIHNAPQKEDVDEAESLKADAAIDEARGAA